MLMFVFSGGLACLAQGIIFYILGHIYCKVLLKVTALKPVLVKLFFIVLAYGLISVFLVFSPFGLGYVLEYQFPLLFSEWWYFFIVVSFIIEIFSIGLSMKKYKEQMQVAGYWKK